MNSTIRPRSEIAGLSALVAGAGRPVVLLHGVGLTAEAWNDQFDILSQDYRVIAPDMPGHGQSPCLRGPMVSLQDYAQAILPLIESLADPALIVGHSMGALIAIELAAVLPSKVLAIAALNAVFERSPEAAAAIKMRVDCLDGTHAPDPKPTLDRWFGPEPSPERTACETWLRDADPEGYKMAYTAFAGTDAPSRGTLRAITCPALFATGRLDPNSTPEMSYAMADLAQDGRALIVEGAAHMMPMTHSQKVTAALAMLAQEV